MKQINYVIGYPLTSSLSPQLHQWIYEICNIDADMQLLPFASIEACVDILKKQTSGLIAVTMPYKNAILSFCDELSDAARAAQAVNTIVIHHGKWFGDNTDMMGITQTLKHISLNQKNILLLGGGGAARAFAYFAKSYSSHLYFCNRRKEISEELAVLFSGKVIEWHDLSKQFFSGIVNATPVGMDSFADTRIYPRTLFHKDQFVFDMIYNPQETYLLKKAKLYGAETFSGLTMFIYQAIAQVNVWKKNNYFNQININECLELLKRYLA